MRPGRLRETYEPEDNNILYNSSTDTSTLLTTKILDTVPQIQRAGLVDITV